MGNKKSCQEMGSNFKKWVAKKYDDYDGYYELKNIILIYNFN